MLPLPQPSSQTAADARCACTFPTVAVVSQRAARCWCRRKSQGPVFSPTFPQSLPCAVSSAWCLGWQCPGLLLWLENARLAVGEDQRGTRGAEDWGGSPYTIDVTTIGLLGNTALQVGTEDPQPWAGSLASHRERISEVGSNPRFSFWLPQDGNHCFLFPPTSQS